MKFFRKRSNKTYKASSQGVKISKKIVLVCYRYEKLGHYQNKCMAKKKINALEVDLSLNKTPCKILINELEGEDLELKLIQKSESSNDVLNFDLFTSFESQNCKKNYDCDGCITKIHFGININVLT